MIHTPPVVVVLAAGRGSRFDGSGHKLTQPLHDRSVLATTLSRVIQSGLPSVLVTTAELVDEARELIAQHDIVVLPSTETQRGMARSIVAGVSARADAPGWLILPADMPLVRPESLRTVAQALPGHACVVPYFQGRRGHPVAFSAELFSELMALTGDEGARRLLMRYPAQAIELADSGILIDIDTQDDLRRAREPLPGTPS